uniref:Uncharacterized protein n=1 Tax=Setaria digitata TaxID=48799 RepID=A0A915PH58_9BILA
MGSFQLAAYELRRLSLFEHSSLLNSAWMILLLTELDISCVRTQVVVKQVDCEKQKLLSLEISEHSVRPFQDLSLSNNFVSVLPKTLLFGTYFLHEAVPDTQ